MEYHEATGTVTLDDSAIDRARPFTDEDIEHLRDVILIAQEATGAISMPGVESLYYQLAQRVSSEIPEVRAGIVAAITQDVESAYSNEEWERLERERDEARAEVERLRVLLREARCPRRYDAQVHRLATCSWCRERHALIDGGDDGRS